MAAAALGVPIVLVSYADETRDGVLHQAGHDPVRAARGTLCCKRVIEECAPLVVPDASRDPRFKDEPLMTGAAHIRAYAGVPIVRHDIHAIGCICALDQAGGRINEGTVSILQEFALLIEDIVEHDELELLVDGLSKQAAQQEMLFHATFEQPAIGFFHMGLDGEFLRINACACKILQRTAAELKLMTISQITHAEDREASSRLLDAIRGGAIDVSQIEKRCVRQDGTIFSANVMMSLVRGSIDEPPYITGVIEDISIRKQTEVNLVLARDNLQAEVARQTSELSLSNNALRSHVAQLLQSESMVQNVEHRLVTMANNLPAMIGYWNRELKAEFANNAYTSGLGYTPAQILGKTMRDVLGEARFKGIEPRARRALEGHEQRFEITMPEANGQLGYYDIRFVPDINKGGAPRGFFVLVHDMTTYRNVQLALEAANAKLANTNSSDYLTGIANRRVFNEHGEAALLALKAGGTAFGIILIDIQEFRRVNAEYGFEAGDDVLRAVAKLIKVDIRSHRDIAARLAGGHFAMLCFGDLDEELLWQIAEGSRTRILREAVESKAGKIRVSASFGAALASAEDEDWSATYRRAESALNGAKQP